jgi:hypothetical protein
MSDTDVFIISIVQRANASEAIKEAISIAGLNSARVQDVIFGLDGPRSIDTEKILSASNLTCSVATVSSSLRAIFFAAQSILSFDVDVLIVLGIEDNISTAILLASPDAVGRWNLLPRARLAARSLNGIESALRAAEIELKDVTIVKNGKYSALLIKELLNELEQKAARWGIIKVKELALLMERI